MQRQQVLSTDQRRLEVDAFARYRIIDPLLMYIRAGSEEQLREQLRPILGSEVRNELGRVEFASLLTPERQGIMDSVRTSLNQIARQYGVEIIDVRIKRTDLPDGAPLAAAFDRMRTSREQEARSIQAQGAKQAAIIRAQADADARRPMPRASARIRNSTISTARCSPIRRPSSATARTSPRRPTSFCRRRTTI